MPATFSSATPSYMGGNNLNVDFALTAANTLDVSTRTVSLLVQDVSSGAPARLVRLDRGDVRDGLNETDGAKMTKNSDGSVLSVAVSVLFGGVKSKKVQLKIIENRVAADGVASESSLLATANSTVEITSVPSAPAASFFKNPTFAMNNARTGVLVTGGVARFVIPPKEGTAFLKVFAKGVLANGDLFGLELSSSPVAVAADAKHVDVPLSGLSELVLAHEKPFWLFGISENKEGESDPSAQLSGFPSLRLPAPKLSNVKSLENKKVTVQGSIPSLPAGNATSYMSIVSKLKSDHDEEHPLEHWKTTDVVNIAFTASSASVSFKKEVKKIRGGSALADLENGASYMLAAIYHTAAITATDNHPVDPESLTAPSALTQSLISNIMLGVPCTYLDDAVDLNVESQSSSIPTDLEQHVTFAPSFDGVSTMTNLPLNAKFTFIANGLTKAQLNDTADLTFPAAPFYKVKNPLKGTKYVIGVDILQPLSEEAAASIVGEPALKVVQRDNIPYAVLKTFEKTVEQTPSSDDVPLVKEFVADYQNIAGRKVLYTAHKSPSASAYADKGLALVGHEFQVMVGVAGDSTDASYVHKQKLTTAGATSLFVAAVAPSNASAGSSYTDLPELNALKLYNSAGAVVDPATGFYSIRIRSKVKVTKTNAEFNGMWQSATLEVQALKLPSPSSVSMAPYADAGLNTDLNAYKLKISHTTVTDADMSGFPPGWFGARPVGWEGKLVDENGDDVEGTTANKPFSDVELSEAVAGAATSAFIVAIKSSEGQIYTARVRNQYVRLNAVGEAMADKAYGSWGESQSYVVKGKMSIASALVKTSPLSSSPSGRDSTGMDTLSIEVGLNIGKMNPANASITVFMKGLTPAGAAQSIWNMSGAQYNATKKLYILTVAADPNADYSYPIFIHGSHPDFPNSDAKSL
jgi:hypothetical protein